jgi:hypothetical protein
VPVDVPAGCIQGVTGAPLDPSSALVRGAVSDLAWRLSIDEALITVVEARSVTWGDRSYGCPEPGVNHLQVPVDGALVVLRVGDRRYEYHGGDPLRLCSSPRSPARLVPPRSV